MSEKNYDAAAPQPMPVGEGVDVAVVAAERLKELGYDELAEDIEARIRLGERKYGTRLKAFNGRDAYIDLYQELLDSINYSQQVIIEHPEQSTVTLVGTPYSLFGILVVLASEVQKQCKKSTNV